MADPAVATEGPGSKGNRAPGLLTRAGLTPCLANKRPNGGCLKPTAFDYVRAESVSHAVRLLAEHKDRARIIAGGQSLLTAMNFRMSSPEILVDIGEIEDLRDIALTSNARLRIGALTPPRRSGGISRHRGPCAVAPTSDPACGACGHPQSGDIWRQLIACRSRIRASSLCHGA